MWGDYSVMVRLMLKDLEDKDWDTSDFRKFLEPLVPVSEDSAETNEKRIYLYLSLLTQGLISPRDIQGFISED